MGHSWREMDPQGAAAQDREIRRSQKLVSELYKVPLSELTVKDLNPILRVTGFDIMKRPYGSDFDYLEGRLEEIKARQGTVFTKEDLDGTS